jgi:hypothetical protein
MTIAECSRAGFETEARVAASLPRVPPRPVHRPAADTGR